MSDPVRSSSLDRLAALGESDRVVGEGSAVAELVGSIIVPGITTLRRRPVLGVALMLIGVIIPVALLVWAYSNRDDLVGFALSPRFLNAVVAVGLLIVVVRLAAVAEVAHAYRTAPAIGVQTAVATFAVVVLALPVLWVALRANEARTAVANVFASDDGVSLYIPTAGTETVDPTAVTNVLLIGGDAGPGRWGMRTDTMIIVSIHEASGRTALVSVPRNLTRLMFPPGTPLAEEFPNGFDDLANAIFTHVNGRQDLVDYYGSGGLQPEAVALSEGIGYSLGIEIDDFALVNMQGFADVIDAVGGVTLDVPQNVPLPPVSGATVPSSIGPGLIEMDGTLAIAYVRSRAADSDYQRMGRQRQLLAALGSQVSAGDALAGFSTVTGLLDDSMRTSLSSGEFSKLLDRLGDNAAIGESVGLAPPIITPGSPNYPEIQGIVDAVEQYVSVGTPSGYAS